ncbi:MAG: M48 family metallopeptidase [Candidatus Scalindua sp.]|nr:M48 family metallopeptidase [Candidatus Scalindua sp.]
MRSWIWQESNSANKLMNDLGFEYKVIRTNRRKTASISVKDEVVSILVPENIPDEKVQAILSKKSRWIKDKLNYYQGTRSSSKGKDYVSGEGFPYLGRNYRLKILSGKLSGVWFKDGRLVVQIPKNFTQSRRVKIIKEFLEEWYQERALFKLKEKARRLSRKVGVAPKAIGIKSYKGRWAGCSKSHEVFFNWNIIMAPNRVVDYVVIHELVHLIHHDHSKEYWKKLKAVFPDYLECKEWLKVNGRRLHV